MNKYNFFALVFRMKYINRWALMRNTRNENVSEHSLEVAVIAHCLALIQKKRLGNTSINPDKVAVYALFHDSSEIITGDLPTPVKYYNESIKEAYKEIEAKAGSKLLDMLPDYLREEYEEIFIENSSDADDSEIRLTVKAADKISAYLKCIEEENAGNKEFQKAKKSILQNLIDMNREDVCIFLEEFAEGFSLTLDELGADIK